MVYFGTAETQVSSILAVHRRLEVWPDQSVEWAVVECTLRGPQTEGPHLVRRSSNGRRGHLHGPERVKRPS